MARNGKDQLQETPQERKQQADSMKRFTVLLIAVIVVWLYIRLREWQKNTFYQCTMRGAGDYVPIWYGG